MADSERLLRIRNVQSLVEYLSDELHWPIESKDADDVTFSYDPEELGLQEEHIPKVKRIYQLRKLSSNQPWGVFFIEFENKKLPVTILRRALHHLSVKGRRGAAAGIRGEWNANDLLFITTFGESDENREIAFAHFHKELEDLPALRVLGWDNDDTPLKLDQVSSDLKTHLCWPADTGDQDAWRKVWQKPFKHGIGHTITTASKLAAVLAKLAKDIRSRCNSVLERETERGPMTKLFKAFQSALIHDLKPEDFADTYAQTITYGLLTAAISRTDMEGGASGTSLHADNVADMVPVTNPFLKEMLQTFLTAGGRKGGIDFDELGTQDVVELLRSDATDMPAILRDFGNRKPGEDPVIHFYEHFLAAYDKKMKVKRGVFYTPRPVVSFIVRSVHELLQTEFGLEDGLASTVTWGEMAKRMEGLTIPEGSPQDSPFVVVLDPAVGTATFLVEVVDVIRRHLAGKWQSEGREACYALLSHPMEWKTGTFEEFWNVYVPDHLLPRLYGYELMMAPYAIAHMKMGLKLGETGYKFRAEGRVRIYLTNALEPATEMQPRLALDWEALAHEAIAVKAVKETQGFTVVIGNPPYSGHSANAGKDEKGNRNFIGNLIHDYYFVDGVPLGEKNPKWLQDDYVKFLRFGQYLIQQSGVGAVGMITNHGYLDNPTFRGMRRSLMQSFDELRFLDLHGNAKKKEVAPDGSKDENVFDIMQGVAICLLVKDGVTKGESQA